jgi:hypothetical protein
MKHRSRTFLILSAVLAIGTAVLWLAGCHPKAQKVMTFSSQNIASGEVILIDAGQDVFDREGRTSVYFDSAKADIVRVVNEHEAEVMVPAGISGKVMVRIEAGNKKLEPQAFQVARPISQKLMLTLEGSKVSMVGTMPTGAEFQQNTASRDRVIVYKVYDGQGTLLAQGVKDQPVGSMEIFDDPKGQPKRESAMHMGPVSFSITIPNYSGPLRVRFFEGDNTEETLSFRDENKLKPLNEITLENR